MKKLVIVVALIGATFLTTEANAFWFFRCRCYYPIRACKCPDGNELRNATPSGPSRACKCPDGVELRSSSPSGPSQGRLESASTSATPSGDLRPRLIPDNDASCNSCPSGPSQGRLINPVEPGEYLPTPSDLSAIERELIAEAIRVRGRVLAIDRLCCQRSRRNSDAQASYCQLGHFTGSAYEIAGVGYGSPAAAVQGWLNSPAHRAILLRADFTKVGAAVRRGRDGRLYWTMNFSR